MNIKNKHQADKAVSAQALFKGETGVVAAIQILAGEQLMEHTTKTPAMLLCISGQVEFENENGLKESLKSGDYVDIDPMVKHWVCAAKDSQLVLMK